MSERKEIRLEQFIRDYREMYGATLRRIARDLHFSRKKIDAYVSGVYALTEQDCQHLSRIVSVYMEIPISILPGMVDKNKLLREEEHDTSGTWKMNTVCMGSREWEDYQNRILSQRLSYMRRIMRKNWANSASS